MDSQFNVVFTGELKPGTEREAFIKAFSERFQCTDAKAAEVLDAGKPVTMKGNVTQEVAEQFKQVLEELGMTIELQPAAQAEPAPAAQAESAPAATNPYEAPKANLQEDNTGGAMTGPVSVPFGHGMSWISDAFSNHFKANPGAWIGGFIVFAIISIAIQLVPLLGALAVSLLSPVFTAGFMIGSQAQDQGEDFTIGHIFSGFQQSTGQLIMVGLLYLIGMIVVMVIVFAFMGGSMAMFMPMDPNDPAAAQAMMQSPFAMLLPMLVMMALFIPLMMAYWFAPALVALDGVSAVSAMKMSFSGCLKNVLPFLLYGIVMFVAMIIAMLPFMLGLLVVVPIMIASMYTSYRDIYYPEA